MMGLPQQYSRRRLSVQTAAVQPGSFANNGAQGEPPHALLTFASSLPSGHQLSSFASVCSAVAINYVHIYYVCSALRCVVAPMMSCLANTAPSLSFLPTYRTKYHAYLGFLQA